MTKSAEVEEVKCSRTTQSWMRLYCIVCVLGTEYRDVTLALMNLLDDLIIGADDLDMQDSWI